MLKHGILGLLNYGDMTGYEIRETFSNSLNFFWQAQSSQIYRELHTLESSGWITMTTVEQTTKPNKNICSITESGRIELLQWLCSDNPELEIRSPILMQVFFLGNRTRNENIQFFRRLADACRDYMASVSDADKSIGFYKSKYNMQEHSLYWEMTADYGRRSLQMHIDWAEHCIAVLEDSK